jgi:hypothetical protein
MSVLNVKDVCHGDQTLTLPTVPKISLENFLEFSSKKEMAQRPMGMP